ncbi:MAG: PRC-barrel domain-containing protein [Meiothermus sp.]|nr:PRC-barrel domain-containing protein [Meiothermus sp.]
MSKENRLTALERLGQTDLTPADPNEDIRGQEVVDSGGERLGRVDELLVDVAQRKVRFLQVGSGGFLGMGREHFLIPVDAVEVVGEDAVRVGLSRQRVAESPEYSADLVPDEDFYRSVYDYYGYMPYWSLGYQYPQFPFYRGRGEGRR